MARPFVEQPLEACALCTRLIGKTPTRIAQGAVCNACYQREFVSVDCAACGGPTRSLHGSTPAYCRRCRVKENPRCMRCTKAVARRSLDVPGGKACSYCRRFFEPLKSCPRCGRKTRHLSARLGCGHAEPVCPKCQRSDCETCSCCRKHRVVVARTPQGRPLCNRCAAGEAFTCPKCLQPGVRNSLAECMRCYYRRAAEAEALQLALAINHPWARDLFSRFAQHWSADTALNGRSVQRLRHYACFFVELGETATSLAEVTSTLLLERFGAEGLRRQAVAYAWLLDQGHGLMVTATQAAQDSEERTQQRLLARVTTPWKLELLSRYQRHLRAVLARWRKRGWSGEHERFLERTVTLLMSAAWRFLERLGPEHVSPQSIDRPAFEALVTAYPGHRNSLHSFVSYLNRKEHLFQKLHLDRSEPHSFPYADLLTPERAMELRQRWLACSPEQTRNALLCLLMLVYVRTAKQVCNLRLRTFNFDEDGQVTARFGAVSVTLDDGVAKLLRRHVAALQAKGAEPLCDDAHLFPSAVPGRCFSTAGAQYVLGKEGVTANQMYTTGLASFFRAGLRNPKVVVRALGITDQTAVKYWQVFNPRLADEITFLNRGRKETPES